MQHLANRGGRKPTTSQVNILDPETIFNPFTTTLKLPPPSSLGRQIHSPSSQSNFDILGPSEEIVGYFPDIFEYRKIISSPTSFKVGFGIDFFRQWQDDAIGGYGLEERFERASARSVQGAIISQASVPFGDAGAAASEIAGPLPGDGVVGFVIGYVAANKAFTNATESFMQKTVFPLFPIFSGN